MFEKWKSILTVGLLSAFVLGFGIWAAVKPADALSTSERRPLAQMPELSASSYLSGKFMSGYEDYATDQFPLREQFRTLKALMGLYVFGQKDNNGVYLADGFAAKLEYPLNEGSVTHAADRFRYLYETLMAGTDTKVYLSAIPDKNYFLAEANGYPALDYQALTDALRKQTEFAAYIDLFGTLTVFGTGNATQVNTITTAINTALTQFHLVSDAFVPTLNLIIGIFCAMLVAMVLLGGIKRIGSVSEKLVPFMALFYVVLGIGVVLLNVQRLPGVLQSIFEGAFNPAAFTGGIIGSLFVSMQKGVSRGIFSNEAGLGTGSIAHACADTQKPVTQGMFGIFEVFADTIIICTLTALVILCSGTPVIYGVAAGAELTISGFTTTYGSWSSIFTAVALCCFAFSTIIGWGLYGSRFVQFLFRSNKVVRPFLVIYSFVSILGATLDLGLLWDIADTFNGLMSIPNLIALLLLSGMVVKLTKEHFPGKGAVRKTGE